MGQSLQGSAGRPMPGLPWLRMLQRLFLDESTAVPDWASVTLPPPGGAGAEGHSGCCVLVVDDNPVNLLVASEMLLSLGLVPMQAADGAEAVALAREVRLNVILMDLQMPVLDGLSATRQIRQFEQAHRRDRVPVVAYTSRAPALRVLQSWGIDDVLDKPCDRHALQGSLQRWCPHLLPAAAPFRAPARGLARGFSAPCGPPG